MKCPKCGFVSFDYLERCKKCQGELAEHKSRFGLRSLVFPVRRAQAPTAEPLEETPAAAEEEFDLGFDFTEPAPAGGEGEPLFAEEDPGELPDLKQAWESPLPEELEAGPLTTETIEPFDFEETWEEPAVAEEKKPPPPAAKEPDPFEEREFAVAGGRAPGLPASTDDAQPASSDPVREFLEAVDRSGRARVEERPAFPATDSAADLPPPLPTPSPPVPAAPLPSLLAAGLIDLTLLGLVFGAFLLAGNLLLGRAGTLWPDPDLLRQLAAPYFLIFFVLGFGYFTLLHYLTGQTLGKMACRIRVESLDGGDPRLAQVFLRSAGGLLCWLLLGLGFAGALAGRRGWNDRLAGTRVVAAGTVPSP